MEVFLVPLGADRYELYCEAPPEDGEGEAAAAEPDGRGGFFAGLKRRFSEAMAAAEQDRARRESGDPEVEPLTTWGRLRARGLAWIADAIAEQRLLWRLRNQDAAALHFPADITRERAMEITRAALTQNRDRHRFWLAVDGVLMLLAGLLFFVPGPNLLGYYFTFRVVGHFLSWRGARQGLDGVRWDTVSSEPLAELRRAIGLGPSQRERHLVDIAIRLRLDHLVTFVERVAYPSA